jgi:hypothetical protein
MAETLASVIPSAEGPKYDIDKILIDEDPETIVEDGDKDEDEDEESVRVETGGKEETEEEGEEDEETESEPPKVPFSRPSIKDIKAKYPEFFKDFPDLKDAIFREARFTQYFPTVEDAKESFEDNEAFTVLSDAALAGDSAPLLESLHKTDAKSFKAFTASFLPNLYKRDEEAYSVAVTPLFENFLRQAYKAGDENMKNSALNLAQYLFGDDGEASVLGKKTLSKVQAILEEGTKTIKERDAATTESFRKAAGYVSDEVNKNMRILVNKDFDPDKVFTKSIRELLITEIVSKIDRQLVLDKAHVTVMGSRWKRARSNGYTDDDKSKLISTYLARAKSLIPSIREQVRQAALGKSIKAADKTRERVKAPEKEVNQGAPPRGTRQTQTRDYSKMSDREILDS